MKNITNNNKEEDLAGKKMIKMAKKLFPKNRSIMGPDIRESYKIFKESHQEFKNVIFKTGEYVFDWEIPEEWIIKDAYIEDAKGKKFAEFKKNNLHVMGYSIGINKLLSKKDLSSKIYSLPEIPDAIPYITSYYKKDWGFCLKHNELIQMPSGQYKVFIDAKHKKGELVLLEALIPGKSNKEIFFSSYLCHPSMANNELSGPVLLNELISYIKNLKNRYFSYRFVLLPETIGSIAYLSKRLNILKENVLCGFNLSCVGDDREYSHVRSRDGNNLADSALDASLINLKKVKNYSFLDRGSDERQYCAPGIDLPIATFCRTKFGKYPEYHTSKDDFRVVTKNGLIGSYKIMKNLINAFEIGLYPKVKVLCEPQLGKRNLYPTISKCRGVHPAKTRMDILAYCDGKNNIFEIAKKTNINLYIVNKELSILKDNNLIKIHQKKELQN